MLQEEVYKHMKKQFIGYRNFSYQKHFLLKIREYGGVVI